MEIKKFRRAATQVEAKEIIEINKKHEDRIEAEEKKCEEEEKRKQSNEELSERYDLIQRYYKLDKFSLKELKIRCDQML